MTSKFKRPMGFTEMMGATLSPTPEAELTHFTPGHAYSAKIGTMPDLVELRKIYSREVPQKIEFLPVKSGEYGKWETGVLESFETNPTYLRIRRF